MNPLRRTRLGEVLRHLASTADPQTALRARLDHERRWDAALAATTDPDREPEREER